MAGLPRCKICISVGAVWWFRERWANFPPFHPPLPSGSLWGGKGCQIDSVFLPPTFFYLLLLPPTFRQPVGRRGEILPYLLLFTTSHLHHLRYVWGKGKVLGCRQVVAVSCKQPAMPRRCTTFLKVKELSDLFLQQKHVL